MLEIMINMENALLANLLYSRVAHGLCKEKGLQAKHFTDFRMMRGNRARYYQAIMDAEGGLTKVVEQLERTGKYYQGDFSRLLTLCNLALLVCPDWEVQIDYIKKAWLDREIERLRSKDDYEGIEDVLIEFNNSVESPYVV